MGTSTALPPHRDERQYYTGDAHAPHDARLHVRACLGAWQLQHLADVLELVASELVTNAVQHSGGRDVMMWLTQTEASVTVHVSDSNPAPPVRREAEDLDETGRGLAIVEAVSARTGCYPFRSGKIVYADVLKQRQP